jgi:alpha-amylase
VVVNRISLLTVAAMAGCSYGTATPSADAAQPESGSSIDVGSHDAGPPDAVSMGSTSPDSGSLPGKSSRVAFVHLFEWKWTDIAKECRTFLGPKGFTAVQVSPPSEHAVLGGFPWWQRYQTVEYGLEESRSGTRAEFASMVADCAAAGVDIYVDAVINHMTGQASGTGSHGTKFTKYEYPGLYTASDFHQPTCTISDNDYQTNAANVRNCELVGLADLNTGDPSVRTKIASYLVDLVGLGVRGFRIDAAKHMSPTDLDAILSEVATKVGSAKTPYYFFEVIDYGGEAIHASDYFDVGKASGSVVDITEFRYSTVGAAFLGSGSRLADLKDLGSGFIPTERAVVFTNNHDTQRASAIYYKDSANELATVFMLAWPYGYPSIMSSYAFDRSTPAGRDQGPPSDAAGHTSDVSCAPSPSTAAVGTWVCEHRAHAVANMVGFRRATAPAPTVTDWWDNGANQIAFGRGNLGFVVINLDNTPLTRSFTTHLPAGRYCDVVGGDLIADACSGSIVTVDMGGAFTFTVPSNSAIAVHAAAKLP